MLAELRSRIKHMQEQAKAVSKFWKIPMPKTYRAPQRTHKVISDQQIRMQI